MGSQSNNIEVTKEMMDKFNNRPGKPKRWKVDSIKSAYLRTINKNPDSRDKVYDPELVEETTGAATVLDFNITNVLIIRSLKLWGIFVICALILCSLDYFINGDVEAGFFKLIVGFIMVVAAAFMLLTVFKNIGGFIKTLRSSRDSKFKLISAIQILPLILIVLLLLIFDIPILIIGPFLIMGFIGYLIVAGLGYDEIVDLI